MQYINWLLMIFFFVNPVIGWAQKPFDQLDQARKTALADAYYQVGKRFLELGEKSRGEEFIAKAQNIDPKYSFNSQAVPSKPSNSPSLDLSALSQQEIPERPQVVENNLQAEKIVHLQFTKLLQGYLESDTDLIADVLFDPVIFNGKTYSVQDARSYLETFFKNNPPKAAAPSDLYELDQQSITTTSDGVVLNMVAQKNAKVLTNISQWESKQSFVFKRVGTIWKLNTVTLQ